MGTSNVDAEGISQIVQITCGVVIILENGYDL